MEVSVKVLLFFIPFLFSLCFHEFAHGFVARQRGDDTAEMLGRLTMNPFPHLDWLGTVILPITAILTHMPLFGWAKPVPVNPRNFKNPKDDMFWVALAGPLSNILLFFVGLGAFFLVSRGFILGLGREPMEQMLFMFLQINLYLAFFNMLPLHPLDGAKVMERFLPYRWNVWLRENQYQLNLALLVLILFGGLRFMALPVNFLISSSLSLLGVT